MRRPGGLVRKLLPITSISSVLLLVVAAPASANHVKGGTLGATISSTGTLRADLTWWEARPGCAAAPVINGVQTLVITAPDRATRATVLLPVQIVRCIGNVAFYRGSVTYALNSATGAFGAAAPVGWYKLTVDQCCRVAGALNTSQTSLYLTATIKNVPGSTRSTPAFLGSAATGASRGFPYSGDVSAADPEAGPVSYSLLQSGNPAAPDYDSTGPATNVVTLSGSRAQVAAALTAAWTAGRFFVYKVRVADAVGDTAQLDILVQVTSNRPPALDAPSDVTVTAGQTVAIPLSASDPDDRAPKVDSVAIAAGGLPAWMTFAGRNGNPATGTLTVAPPAGAAGVYYAPLDATDTDPVVTLLDSKVIAVRLVPAAPVFTLQPSVQSGDTAPTFTFTGAGRFECSQDGGAFVRCFSPYRQRWIPGPHSLSIRAVDGAGSPSTVTTYQWTIVTPPAPAAPPEPPPVVAPPSDCSSRRSIRVHWRVPARERVRTASVAVSGEITRRLSARVRRFAVDLRGVSAATIRVTVRVRTASRKLLTSSRTYRTCWPGVRPGPRVTRLILRAKR